MKRLLVAASALLINNAILAAPAAAPDVQVQDRGAAGITLNWEASDEWLRELTDSRVIEAALDGDDDAPVISRWVALPQGCRAQVEVVGQSAFEFADAASFRSLARAGVTRDAAPVRVEDHPPVAVGATGVFRGMPIAPVTIRPVQLDPENGGGVAYRSLEVNLNFVPDAAAPVARRVNDRPGGVASRIMDRILLNPPHRDESDRQQDYLAHILIVYDAALVQQGIAWINTLAEWKRKMGYRVSIQPYSQNLEPYQILASIRTNYYFDREDPLDYLLIVGSDTRGIVWFKPHDGDGDHYYSLMDNEDFWTPDIGVGRLHVSNFGTLPGAVTRSILYESDPFDEEGSDWFEHALLTVENINVPSAQYVPSMTQLTRWMASRLVWYEGYELVDTLYGPDDLAMRQLIQDSRDILEDEGVNLAISRGWFKGGYEIGDRPEDDEWAITGRRNPFVIAITCLSGESQEKFFQTATDENNITGPIASIAMKGLTHTKGNNNTLGWCVRGMVYEDIHKPGDVMLLSKYMVYSDLHFNDAAIEFEVMPAVKAYRLYGDPTVNVFLHRPIRMEVDHRNSIALGATGFSAKVMNDNAPVTDAAVALYQPGGFQAVCITGDDGVAHFHLQADDLEEGSVFLTVTREDAFPYLAELEVGGEAVNIELAGISYENHNDRFERGETLNATATFHNSGNSAAAGVQLEITTDSDWAVIEIDSVNIGGLNADAEVEAEFSFTLSSSIRESEPVNLYFKVTANGGLHWEHALQLEAFSHSLSLQRFADNDDAFLRGEQVAITPFIQNMGSLQFPASIARLELIDDRFAGIVEGEQDYNSINPDASVQPADGSFLVDVSEFAIPGSSVEFRLILESGEGQIVDTVLFAKTVENAQVTDPYGPDEYGYIAYDSGDESWSKAPVYDWIEIDPDKPDRDFDGIRVDIRDYWEDKDSSLCVPLPFDFQYYGQVFDTLVINSNGWVAFGQRNSLFVHFRNWRIPGIQGPDAQVCILWQDLIIPDRRYGGIFQYYDDDRGIFIVEWSDLEIFRIDTVYPIQMQIILYDEALHPTSTNDGEIKLQYKSVIRDEGNSGTDIAFSTVGIKNLDNTGGIEWTYWDQYPTQCKPLEDEMAILFTPDVQFRLGSASGRVVDLDNPGVGMQGVTVQALRNPQEFEAVTDAQGRFRFDDLPVGRENLRFSKIGFNTQTVRVDIREAQNTQVPDVQMRHPEISVADDSLYSESQPTSSTDIGLTLVNDGNGPLDYNLSVRYPDGSDTEYRQVWHRSISDPNLTGNGRIFGCELVGDQAFISARDPENPEEGGGNLIYVINRDGSLERQFEQPSTGTVGIQDMAFDGNYLYGGEDSLIYKFDSQGRLIQSYVTRLPDLTGVRSLAYNPLDRTLFAAVNGYKVFEFAIQPDTLIWLRTLTFRLEGELPNIQGLAWNPVDPDGMQLYAMDWDSQNPERRMRLVKANHLSGVGKVVTNLARDAVSSGRSLSVGFGWESHTASLGAISDIGNFDTLRIYELGPDSRFLQLYTPQGSVPAGQQGVSLMTFWGGRGAYPEGTYYLGLLVEHNAAVDPILVQIEYKIDPESNVDEEGEQPFEFELAEIYPNPFNSTARIRFSLPVDSHARMNVYDLAGRLVQTLLDNDLQAGNHFVTFDGSRLASGIYFCKLESAGQKKIQRMVLMR